jgi:threonyl-tRNA synthetase
MKEMSELQKIRHSASHVLAAAVLDMFPEAKLGIGPAIEEGFYYDFELPRTLIPEDLVILEKKMQAFINNGYDFEQYLEPKKKALEFLKTTKQTYKIDLAKDLKDGEVSFFKSGPFVDLCVGPHTVNTKNIKAFKLMSIAGAYWKGDEKNNQLQRIYGTAFESKKDLDEYLATTKDREKYDHKKLGREMEIFAISDQVGAGLPLWLPRGQIIYHVIEQYLYDIQVKAGYLFVKTPHIAHIDLYQTSGHWQHYKDNIYPPIDIEKQKYILKPMNCPHHIEIYKTKQYSYKDLPVRLAEFGTVYRREKSGELAGLTRVRGFTVDDAHIFCTINQVHDEFKQVLDLVKIVLAKFGFDNYSIAFSTRGDDNKKDYVGDDRIWKQAQDIISKVLKKSNIKYTKVPGEAAFYGPKLDFIARDSLGREWQLSTIQIDLNLPERFDIHYIDADGNKVRPIMIHRALLGSLERFIGTLLEHHKGRLPLFLAPEQIRVLSISDKSASWSQKILDKLIEKDFRVSLDDRNESISRKIRDAEMMKIPYQLIIGERESKAKNLSVREYGVGDKGTLSLDKFVDTIEPN